MNSLLSVGEPSPFYVLNAVSEAPILLVCDHASCRFPESLGDMGLDPFARRCHLAIDIGAGSLTECLMTQLMNMQPMMLAGGLISHIIYGAVLGLVPSAILRRSN